MPLRLALPLTLLLASLASAHPANVASALAKVRPDGTFDVRVRFDVLAYAVGETPTNVGNAAMDALLDGPTPDLEASLNSARARFLRESAVSNAATLNLASFPADAAVARFRPLPKLSRFPVMIEAVLTGKLKPGARTMAFRFPDLLDTVVLTVEFPYREPVSEPLTAGSMSATLTLPTEAETRAAAASMGVTLPSSTAPPTQAKAKPLRPPLSNAAPKNKAPNRTPKGSSALPLEPNVARTPVPEKPAPQRPATPYRSVLGDTEPPEDPLPPLKTGPPPMPPPLALTTAPERPSPLTYIPRYVVMGYRHILPEGVDHILFILGLFLLGAKLKPLLAQVTAFTVAHSLTLGLALFGLVRLPPSIVEPIIALSIAFVAIENIWAKEVKPWRILVVFAFGLIHGLGFASALRDLGLGRNDLLPALVGFNVGVELGQLSVVALALLAVGWFRQTSWYRTYIVIPASVLIAAVALFWFVQRIMG